MSGCLLSSSAWHALTWVQAHARELAALHEQLQALPRHLPGFLAQFEQPWQLPRRSGHRKQQWPGSKRTGRL